MKPRTTIQQPSTGFFSKLFCCFFSRTDDSTDYLDEKFFPEKTKEALPTIESEIRDKIAQIHDLVLFAFKGRSTELIMVYQEWCKYINDNYAMVCDDNYPLTLTALDPIPEFELKFISLFAQEKWFLDKSKLESSLALLFIQRLEDVVTNLQQCEDLIEKFIKSENTMEEKTYNNVGSP